MEKYNYTVRLDPGIALVVCQTPKDVYNLLKKKKIVTVACRDDKKTKNAYLKAAIVQDLSEKAQKSVPVFIRSVLSDEGTFVESEEFWIENYMFDEFYNPEILPYVEKIIVSV